MTFNNFLEDAVPKILSAGMSLIWSLAFLFIGLKVISFGRKILIKAMERAKI